MKNVIIINGYANTVERRNVLINCINKLKKLNIDIILISNHQDDGYIQSLIDYYIYDADNFLLPKDKSPLNWFADDKETIHLFHGGTSYIVYKHMCVSISFAKNLQYENFLYLEFDVDFSESDLDKINFILNQRLVNKKMWMCNFQSLGKQAIESRLFAGNVEFFLKNFIFIKSIDDWNSKYPFSTSSDSLEYIFSQLVNHIRDSIYFTNMSVGEYFNSSAFDIFSAYSFINVTYNSENKFEPLLFAITKQGKYNVLINNQMVLNKDCIHNEWIKIKFTISSDLTNLKVLFNDSLIFEENVNLENIENFKNKCILYKIT
jgi:hypothetical protein